MIGKALTVDMDVGKIIELLIAAIVPASIVAWWGARKNNAETDKALSDAELAKAQADEITWAHMVDTLKRMGEDIVGLKNARAERDATIEQLEIRSKACEEREESLIARIGALENANPFKIPNPATAVFVPEGVDYSTPAEIQKAIHKIDDLTPGDPSPQA